MDTTTLFYRFGVALAIGFLVGLQREWLRPSRAYIPGYVSSVLSRRMLPACMRH